MLLPKEHGVYAQVACPLLVALAVARAAPSSLMLAAVFVSAFLLHEPLLVLLGRRGRREQEEHGRDAWRGLTALGLVVVLCGLGALWRAPAATAWLLVPAVPAAVVLAAVWRGDEKSLVAQAGVALAFSCAAVPVGAAAGTPVAVSGGIAAVFAANFVLGSQAVRVVVLRVKGGGDPRASDRARAVVFVVAAIVAVAAAAVVVAGVPVPALAVLALGVGLATPVRLAWRPPAPSQLRRVGWTLVATSSVVTLLLILAYLGR